LEIFCPADIWVEIHNPYFEANMKKLCDKCNPPISDEISIDSFPPGLLRQLVDAIDNYYSIDEEDGFDDEIEDGFIEAFAERTGWSIDYCTKLVACDPGFLERLSLEELKSIVSKFTLFPMCTSGKLLQHMMLRFISYMDS
jgi:hypothetical protein